MLSLYIPLIIFGAVFLAGLVALFIWLHKESKEYRKKRKVKTPMIGAKDFTSQREGDGRETMRSHYTKAQFIVCFACGMGIGPGYEETFPYKAGDKTLCGRCNGTLKKQGHIQLNRFQRLLPNGTVIKICTEGSC